MEHEIKQVDKRVDSNEQVTNPRIIIDANYIRSMKEDGAPFRAMCEQGGRIVITDTLVYELLTSDRNQWPAAKRRLVSYRDSIEVWKHVSEMYRFELKKNRSYGNPLHSDRTERLRFELANNLQYEPDDLKEIIDKARQEREGSNIPELFRNFAKLNKEFGEKITAKIKGKSPHDKEVVQACYFAINDPKSIRSMIDIVRSVMKNDMVVLLESKDVNKKWVIWHYCKSLLTVFCDCGRRGENAFREISENYKKRLYNITYDLEYLVLLAFADAIASGETKGELSYYRRWMFGDVSKPSISYYERKRIGLFIQKLPMSEVTIYVTQQLDGFTCALDPWSRMLLEIHNLDVFPGRIFVSYNSKKDFEPIHGSIWKHLVEILTGYSASYIQASSGIIFVDSKTMDTLFEFSA